MNGWRGLMLATLAAFVVGCAVGLIGGVLVMRFAAPPAGMPFAGRPHPGPPAAGGPLMRMLARRLDFTPEQEHRIEGLLESARGRHEALRESTRAEIARELTPQQRAKWQQMEERWRHRGGGSGLPELPGPDRP